MGVVVSCRRRIGGPRATGWLAEFGREGVGIHAQRPRGGQCSESYLHWLLRRCFCSPATPMRVVAAATPAHRRTRRRRAARRTERDRRERTASPTKLRTAPGLTTARRAGATRAAAAMGGAGAGLTGG